MSEHHVITEWKTEMSKLLKMKYGDKFTKSEINDKLDKIIKKDLKNQNVTVFNNDTNTAVRTNVLDLTDSIEANHLIITGGGCLFLPHGTKPNILIDFILEIMKRRKDAKKMRKNFEKGSDGWLKWDIAQLLNKLVINSLYGCMGYPGFLLYNVFTAEAITSEGRFIITTAINCIEAFLGNAFYFVDESELTHYIYTIHAEYKKYGELDVSKFGINVYLPLVYDRLIEKSKFTMTDKMKENLLDMLTGKPQGELALLYYKNNLLEFSKLDFVKAKFKYIIENNGLLSFCEMDLLKNDEMRQVTKSIWDLYEVFVLYNYPINDKIRKAMYLPKTRALYTDTDSVFVSVCHLVDYIKNDVLHGNNPMASDNDLTFTSVNLMLIFINIAVDRYLKTLCYSTNIEPEYAEKLGMKNEFYLKRILFVEKKKRYISLSILQEGQLLGKGRGKPEIKGFEFIKSNVKPYLRDFYTQLATDEILEADEISPSRIFKKMAQLKSDIEYGMSHGDSKFYKQAKVKTPDNYKNPFSTQGITAVMLWNAICPTMAIELPADVNIVPIKSLRLPKPPERTKPTEAVQLDPFKNKNIEELADKYPDVYQRLYNEIYTNVNPQIRYMNLSSIALPKNSNITIPQYVFDLINYDDIVTNSIQLFLPVMESLGIRSVPTTSNTNHMTNIIQL